MAFASGWPAGRSTSSPLSARRRPRQCRRRSPGRWWSPMPRTRSRWKRWRLDLGRSRPRSVRTPPWPSACRRLRHVYAYFVQLHTFNQTDVLCIISATTSSITARRKGDGIALSAAAVGAEPFSFGWRPGTGGFLPVIVEGHERAILRVQLQGGVPLKDWPRPRRQGTARWRGPRPSCREHQWDRYIAPPIMRSLPVPANHACLHWRVVT